MDGWNRWKGLEVFLRLKSGRVYSGKVIEIDNSGSPIIFITIIDKFGKNVTIVSSEILEIKEEKRQ